MRHRIRNHCFSNRGIELNHVFFKLGRKTLKKLCDVVNELNYKLHYLIEGNLFYLILM